MVYDVNEPGAENVSAEEGRVPLSKGHHSWMVFILDAVKQVNYGPYNKVEQSLYNVSFHRSVPNRSEHCNGPYKVPREE